MQNAELNSLEKIKIPTETIPKPIIERKKGRVKKTVAAIIVGILFLGTIMYLTVLYKQNFTPNEIVKKSYSALFDKRAVSYSGEVKLTFSYSGGDREIVLNEAEIYPLLKRSSSDSHSVSIKGIHEWKDVAKGNFEADWMISEKDTFILEGRYLGNELNYKIRSDLGINVEDEKSEGGYSTLLLNDIALKLMDDEDRVRFENISKDDFKTTVVEVLANDILNGQDCRHYKIRLDGMNNAADILNSMNPSDLDVWIVKKTNGIRRIKGCLQIKDIGLEGNDLDVCFDIDITT